MVVWFTIIIEVRWFLLVTAAGDRDVNSVGAPQPQAESDPGYGSGMVSQT